MNQSQHITYHTGSGQTYLIQSYAKINLTLDVSGRRDDGYHELITIMQTLALYDTLYLTTIEENHVHLTCTRADLSNTHNLAARAAEAVRQYLGIQQGLAIELQKRVPVAAGLGGGSSNAASVLLALMHLWNLPLSLQELQEIAASLGSDVPFFLTGGMALCQGRGEHITPLHLRWPKEMRWILLLKPAIDVSTATVYRNLTPSDYCAGASSHSLLASLETGNNFSFDYLHNSLERGVLEHYPAVAQAQEAVRQAGAPFVQLSGSGPTLFAPFATLTPAALAQRRLQKQGYEVYLTYPFFPGNKILHLF
jgi:4-diphosphocytidyl-2-C-methyl-D-erythritol kinase